MFNSTVPVLINTVPGITCEEIASHAELSAATGDYKTTSEKMKQRAFNFYFLFGQVYRSRRSFLYIYIYIHTIRNTKYFSSTSNKK